jgi:hypothetical protein
MAVRRIAGDEDATLPISIGRGNAQLPEADVLKLHVEVRPNRGVKILPEVEIILGRSRWDGRMEEPCRTEIHTTEELPVSLQLRIKNIVV